MLPLIDTLRKINKSETSLFMIMKQPSTQLITNKTHAKMFKGEKNEIFFPNRHTN